MFKKSLIASVSALMLIPSVSVGATSIKAYTDEDNEDIRVQKMNEEDNIKPINISEEISEKDKIFMSKLEAIYSDLELDSDNHLVLNVSDSELREQYNFSDQDIDQLHKTISFQRNNADRYSTDSDLNNNHLIAPALHVSDWKVYFTTDDIRMYLGSAIQAGAPAVVAALASLGSVVATPGVGTVMGALAGLFSGGTILYQLTQALANEQGWYIGVDWNGAFPNPTMGFW